MLARETKIHNLIHQRNFIQIQLESFKKDGDPAYRYIGYLYPENRKYFETEGYDIITISSVDALKIGKGLPLNIFMPSDGIELTPDEETTSKMIAAELCNISDEFENFIKDILKISENDDNPEDREDEEK